MQNTNKVQQGQSFIDMVCQLTGSFEDILAMAILNNKSITEVVAIGEEIAGTGIRDIDTVTQFSKKQPATADLENIEDPEENLEGISYWIINKNFIVQ
ncbi:hypothetical protein SAMN05421847_2194 [Halpernia humi]|uniref:Uncharacterized protein n=1 Tax=Halpernia humi TaxID=493375 RepID=A0A1H5ZT13_9FLAO|nr:hypothetical protein [Halpernia humi]SEG39579.1 hypothetical protein SAMN05421847_2194 [Halpernia humi]